MDWQLDIEATVEATKRQHAEGCVKIAEDLDRYRAVIAKVRPTLIVECGTFSGGSALWFADVADCPVVTFDVKDSTSPDIREKWAGRVTYVLASSTSSEARRLVRMVVGPTDRMMLVLDSDHAAPHVMAELDAHADLATYIVVEDGVVRWMGEAEQRLYVGNPLDAIEAWFPDHHEWAEDHDVAQMSSVSMHPRGWWMRGTQ